ncbi:MAG: hypothetical protein RRA94_01490 [Bacteroidota bacterium]|nr:hypothetical protein [Bacteroidota bacterium]
MSHLRTSLFLTVILALSLAACQNDPDPTGIGLIPDGDVIGAERFDSAADDAQIRNSSFTSPIPAAAATSLLIGEADGYSAKALVRWYQIADTIGNRGRIVSASLRLFSKPGHIGDSSAAMEISVREIKGFWSSFTFTSDSLASLDYARESSGTVTTVVGGADSVEIPLDSVLVRKWLVLMNEKRFTENYGVLLEASGGLRAFRSEDGGRAPELSIVIEENGLLDTLIGTRVEDTYVATGPDFPPTTDISVHSGLVQRSRLFLDVSGIPGASIVNYASLYLRIDRSRSSAGFSAADSVLIYQSYDSTDNTLEGSALLTRVDENDPDLLIAEGVMLTRAVQTWVNGKGNHGLLLAAWAENSELERLTLYGAEADSTRRPRLVVTYTSKP